MTPTFCRHCGQPLVAGATFCGGCGQRIEAGRPESTSVAAALERLVAERGEGILADPDQFRAALDDYLDESDVSAGVIYLLTDAVRLGALESLRAMVSAGATPASAVESAGGRLARDRGSSEPVTGVWAAAVLGHAVGMVPEAVVEQYGGPGAGHQHGATPARDRPPSAPPTMPAAPTPPAAPPTALPPPPGPPPPGPPAPSVAPLPVVVPTNPIVKSAPTGRTGSKVPVLLVGLLAVLVMFGVGGGTAYLLTRDDDAPSDRASDSGGPEESTATDVPTGTTSVGTDAPTATVTVTEGTETGTDVPAADPETALRDIIETDRIRAESLVGSWVPQLASISGEIDGSWSSALEKYDELKEFFPDIVLVDAAEWQHAFIPSATFDDVLVVLSPTPASPTSAPVLDWCQLNRGDRQASCYAKLLETSGSPRDNTDQNDPEPKYN
jgi:hypothetical protein